MDLLPLDEARRRLRVVSQSYVGVREIPVERIIGSLDRTADFDRSFRPRRDFSRGRLASLRGAFPHGRMPPIEVQELGGAYFVADGRHRVALAREREAAFIDAEVTRLQTNYEVGPDVDVCQLVHTEQQRMCLEESGLGRARPDALIEFSRPGGYPEFLEIVKAHGYDVARRRAGATRCRPGRRSPPTGTTPSTAPGSLPCGAKPCRRCTPTRPTRTCSSGSTSAGARCASPTRPPTSTTQRGPLAISA